MRILFFLWALVGFSAAAQSLKDSGGNPISKSFEACEPQILGFPNTAYSNHNISCGNWQYLGVQPSTSGHWSLSATSPVISPCNVGKVFAFASSKVDSTGVAQQEIFRTYASDLVPGNSYVFSLYQVLGYTAITNGQYSRCAFQVEIGDELFMSDEMSVVGTGNLPWSAEQQFGFCAQSTTQQITITPVIINPMPGQYNEVIIGLDEVDLKADQENYCNLPEGPCKGCGSLQLISNQKYVVSGWVMQTDLNENVRTVSTYDGVGIQVKFVDVSQGSIPSADVFVTSYGEIIDGWQRISGEFVVPVNANVMTIELVNQNENFAAFFDDVRVHPSNGSLKSFVYDQQNHKLMAELDENNYATMYEYDKEGGLVRVKKETEKGVMTIKESRSSNKKR